MVIQLYLRYLTLFLIPVVAGLTCSAQTNDLPRHAVIGLQVGPADQDKPENSATNPATIRAVIPGGAGEAAGLQVGDVLVSLDGVPVTTGTDFAQRIVQHLAGDSVTVHLRRQGVEISKSVTLQPRPLETSPDSEVLYTSVTVNSARRRVIVTQPRTAGRHPAVLLIGGLGCYSLDGELSKPIGYGPILAALAKNSYVTMRVEKTGEGDSACTDAKATAEMEEQGYTAGLRLLKTYDFVDPAHVFIFAHSLGPLLGSLVITQEPVRGFVAAETIGRSWFEYGLENVRRQSALLGEPLDRVDAEVRAHAVCASHFFLQHEPAEQVTQQSEQCADMIRSYAGVPSVYMQQIGDLSLAKQWKNADMPVLVLYGTSDPATSADESQYLVELINSFHPGRATYLEIPGMGHDFARYDSQREFLTRRKEPNKPHRYDDEVVIVLLRWLSEHS